MNILWLVLSLLMIFIMYHFQSLRFYIIFKRLNGSIGYWSLCRVTIITAAINNLSPFRMGQLIARPFLLKKLHGVAYKKSGSAGILEQMVEMGFLIVVFIVCLNGLVIPKGISIPPIPAISALFLLIFVFLFYSNATIPLMGKILNLVKFLTPTKLLMYIDSKYSLKQKNILQLWYEFQTKKGKNIDLIKIILFSIVLILLPVLSFMYFLYYLGITLDSFQAFIVYWVPFIAGRASGVPGGLGVKDALTFYILRTYGVSYADAITAAIAYRLACSVFVFLLALISSYSEKIDFWEVFIRPKKDN